jgi:hypothetical protein
LLLGGRDGEQFRAQENPIRFLTLRTVVIDETVEKVFGVVMDPARFWAAEHRASLEEN